MLSDLANALAVNGDIEAARQRYRAADLAFLTAGRPLLRLTVLNNLAYSEHRAGEAHRALAAATQLRELATAQRVPLHPTHLETIARAPTSLGRQRVAQALAQQAMFETSEARREARLFREQALRDPLTGLRNRRFVTETLPIMIDAAARTGRPLSVAMLDLDHFKRINDTISHDTGDRVLITVAGLLAAAVGNPDGRDDGAGAFVARLGGGAVRLVPPRTRGEDAPGRAEALPSTIRRDHRRPD